MTPKIREHTCAACNGTGFPSSGFTAPVAPPAPVPHAPAAVPAAPAKHLPVSQYEETGYQGEVMPPISAGQNYQTGAFEQGYALPANPPGAPVSLL